ncbi:unnamed protein product [Rotaria sordida]|uniref:Uncharacterized protein n=1 Tax=Rotaria sordida TaxID=392033 RepID=A0A815FAY9_9BILA|nr:unnamed protein product [Rotaria sordida]
MQPLSWSNTVQLTLSIQYFSELRLLFEHNALPAIEYLNITIENLDTNLPFNVNISASNVQLSKYSLRETATGDTHLKHLLLRYITLNDVMILIGSITMPLLEELILIDMYDDTLDHLGQFQELCSSTYLPALKTLHFSLCFPQEIEHEWRMSSFNCNNQQWPFDNINCYMDECYMCTPDAIDLILKILFVIYNCPINLLYRHKRTFHNYGFATHISAPICTIRRRLIQWVCDQKYETEQFNKTLQIVASGHVNELHLTYLNERNPKHYFDIHRLNEIVPHLYLLETSDAIMKQNEYLVEFILNISHQFDQLIYLVLNKNCRYRSKNEKKIMFRDKLITATHDQIFHGNNIHFQFHINDELRIWF